MNGTSAVVIDAALRFARSNPQVLALAYSAAPRTGRSVDELLLDAVSRMRAAAERAAAERSAAERAAARHGWSAAHDRAPVFAVLSRQRRRYRSKSVASRRRTESNAYS
jgi:hypothetical protein